MPNFEFTSPEGQKYTVAGPEGSTKEEAFGILQQQLAAKSTTKGVGGGAPTAPASPAIPEHKPETLSHLAGLATRYGVEMLGTTPTGALDLGRAGAEAYGNMASVMARGVNKAVGGMDLGSPAKLKDPYEHLAHGATELFNKGLDSMGFAKFDAQEQAVRDKIDMAAVVLTAGTYGLKAAPKLLKPLISTYQGEGVRAAGEVAAKAVKGAVYEAYEGEITKAKALELAEKRQLGLSKKAAADREAIDKLLSDPKKPLTTYGKIGETTRQIIGSRLEEKRIARETIGNKDQEAVKAKAAAKEAVGEFLQPKSALAPMKELAEVAKNVPGLGEKAQQFVTMLEGATGEKATAPKASTILDAQGKPMMPSAAPAAKVTQSKGSLNFNEAELMRRFLNDTAYGADVEGYDAIFRNAAREAAKGLNADMEAFVPEQKAFRENWARNSQPLNMEGTRLNKLLFSTEGGLRGDVWEKVAHEKIPARVFSDTASMDVLAETLAGGPNATVQERAAAEKQVQDLALQYFSEKARPMNTEALKRMATSPEMQDVLKRAPKAAKELQKTVAHREAMEIRSKVLAEREKKFSKAAEESGKQARAMRAAHDKMVTDVGIADALLAQKETKFQLEAVQKYRTVLDNARKAGIVDSDKYSAMLTLIGRQQSAQQKAELLRKIAHLGLTLGTGTAAGASVLAKVAH